MEDLSNGPKDAQYEKDTHERWEMGQSLEDGHKAEATHTQPEDNVALRLRELCHVSLRKVILLVELTVELILQDKGRHKHGDKRGNENLCDNTLGSDNTLDPQHDSRNIANGRESAS